MWRRGTTGMQRQLLRAGSRPIGDSRCRRDRSLRHFRFLSISIPVLAAFCFAEQATDLDRSIGARADGESVIASPSQQNWLTKLCTIAWREDGAAQIVEFAVSLPLLMVFVVGIFDFSNAFTLKQKLTNVARDAARTAAADPANDLGSPSSVPVSVADAFNVVRNYLLANHINDCGVSGPPSSAGLTWTYTGTTNCPAGGLTLIIDRGYYFPSTGVAAPTATCSLPSTGGITVIGTCVSIRYAYSWRFGRVATLLGSTTLLRSSITAAAVAMNEN